MLSLLDKSIENSINLHYTVSANYLAAKCYVAQGDITEAIYQLKNLLKNEKSKSAQLDIEILSFLYEFSHSSENYEKGVDYWEKWTSEPQGEIFELKYILWFKAVFLMYCKKYSEAAEEFQLILEILHSKDTKSMNADETLASEEENCEVLYNISLCNMFGKKSQSILILDDLAEILNNKHKGQMLLLAAAANLALNNNVEAEKMLKEAFKCDSESVQPFLAKKPIKLLPLNTNNNFAAQFPLIVLKFNGQPNVEVRPAVALPRISLPSLEFGDEIEVKDLFFFKKILPKPEAPWLNRVRGSIQFTENVVDVENEPTEITERENKEETVKETENSKRVIKSMVPLRHYSSEIGKSRSNNEHDETPDDIIKKIRELCG